METTYRFKIKSYEDKMGNSKINTKFYEPKIEERNG